MSNKDYPDFISNSLKSHYDKTIIVEELLEKLKAQGCFDAKRKQFLSEITNKSTYQNLHTKVENLATKFLETVRWPPSVQKHQLREQLRLHIQSTDQFNNCISRLIEQEVNCKIQNELKPLIESKACEYLEVNYEKWKQNMLSQIYENFKLDSPTDKSSLKPEIKSEHSLTVDSKLEAGPSDSEVSQSNESPMETKKKSMKIELSSSINQSSVISSSGVSGNVQSQPKYSGNSSHHKPQPPQPVLHQQPQSIAPPLHSFVSAVPPTAMPPPLALLPPPHRILPNNLFQPLPPPPPPMFLPLDRFPPPPPPDEGKSLPPPPPPLPIVPLGSPSGLSDSQYVQQKPGGPNTPTEEYAPRFFDFSGTDMDISATDLALPSTSESTSASVSTKMGLLKTPDKSQSENKFFSPKKIIWGQIVLNLQDVSDDSPSSDCDRNDQEKRRSTRKSSEHHRFGANATKGSSKRFEEHRPKESHKTDRNRLPAASHSHQKSNDYTDVSSESFNEMDLKDTQPVVPTQKKSMCTSTSDDSHSSSSNDQTMHLIRKINKKKNKLRKKKKTPTQIQSSSSYSSSESSSDSTSSENSHQEQPSSDFRESHREYRVFGRSQSEEKDMDISVGTQSPLLEPKSSSPQREVNLDSVESVQLRKNQIKARLEEIDAKRSILQKQQLMTTTEKCSESNTTSSSSTESSSENTTSSRSSKIFKSRDKESKKVPGINLKPLSDPIINNPDPEIETETNEQLEDMKHDSEPEEGELSSESRAGSLKREKNVIFAEESKSMPNEDIDNNSLKKEMEVVNENDETINIEISKE